jgi:exosortase H (IPTLxxWG-CTERM-specific)
LARRRSRRQRTQSGADRDTVEIQLTLGPLRDFVGRHWLLLRTAALFLLIIGVFIAILALSVDAINATLAVLMAHLSSLTLRLLGAGTTVDGVIVRSSRFAVRVVAGCTGLQTMVVFSAAVLAYPSGIVDKLRGIAVGVAMILFLNLLRIVSLFYIGIWALQYFEMAHLLVWQYLIVATTAILLVAWVRRANDAGRPA